MSSVGTKKVKARNVFVFGMNDHDRVSLVRRIETGIYLLSELAVKF